MKKFSAVLSTFLCSALTLSAQIPTPGAYYPFCGNAANSQNANYPGTPVNAVLTTDRFAHPASAYNFNGTSAFMSLPSSIMAQFDSYSYSLWVRPTATGSNSKIFFFGGTDNKGQYLMFNSANRFTAYGWCYTSNFSSNTSVSISSNSVTLNQWHHVVVTRDNGYIRIYVDGQKVPDDAWAFIGGLAAYYGSGSQRMLLGAMSVQSDFFAGDIDDVRLYSPGALNQSQVTALFQEGPVPNISISSGTICAGESFVFTPSGASTYTFPGGSASITPQTSSDYTITGKNAAGCVGSATLHVSVDACTGLKHSNISDPAFQVYPNPASGKFTLALPALNKPAVFVLQDLSGRVLRSIPVISGQETLQVETYGLQGCFIGGLYKNNTCIFSSRIMVTD